MIKSDENGNMVPVFDGDTNPGVLSVTDCMALSLVKEIDPKVMGQIKDLVREVIKEELDKQLNKRY